MTITISAFEASPDGGRGLARDMRVRWALEEAGLSYEVELVSFSAMKEPAYLALQPFGQIPVYREGALTLFETGAIVFYIAQHHSGLLPDDPDARARAITWMFAALNTMEPPIVEREQAHFTVGEKPWFPELLAVMDDRARVRLQQLSDYLGDSEWLDGQFSAADLLMVLVLRRIEGDGILEAFGNLVAYVERGEARPAYRRAYAAQHKVFTDRVSAHRS